MSEEAPACHLPPVDESRRCTSPSPPPTLPPRAASSASSRCGSRLSPAGGQPAGRVREGSGIQRRPLPPGAEPAALSAEARRREPLQPREAGRRRLAGSRLKDLPTGRFRAASNAQFRRSGGRYRDALPAAPVQKQLYSTASLPEGGRRRLVPQRQASATERKEDVARAEHAVSESTLKGGDDDGVLRAAQPHAPLPAVALEGKGEDARCHIVIAHRLGSTSTATAAAASKATSATSLSSATTSCEGWALAWHMGAGNLEKIAACFLPNLLTGLVKSRAKAALA